MAYAMMMSGSGMKQVAANAMRGWWERLEGPKGIASRLGFLAVLGAGVFGAGRMMRAHKLPRMRYVSPEIAAYLGHDEIWKDLAAEMERYAHFAPAAFCRMCEAITHLIFMNATLYSEEGALTPGALFPVAQLVSIVVECIRVIHAHLEEQYSEHQDVMVPFDESAARIQTQCDDIQHNLRLELADRRAATASLRHVRS